MIFGLALTGIVLLNSGCATMFSHKGYDVILYDAPEDLKVTDNGSPVDVHKVFSHSKTKQSYASTTAVTTSYYTSGVTVDKTKKHTLELKSGGKTASIVLKHRVSGIWFVLDLFTTGPIGIIVDASTHKWRKIKNHRIDAPAVINGTKSRSANQLEKDLKKKIAAK